MKEQYVGDINDYKKYSLLRALSDNGQIKLGICWMLTASDGRSDGNKVGYLNQPKKWRHYSPEVFDLMEMVLSKLDGRKLMSIEKSGIIPDALYFNEQLHDNRELRAEFFMRARRGLAASDLIFFDPDNGLEISSKPKGRKDSNKFLYYDELSEFYHAGKSLLIYQHFPRKVRSLFIEELCSRLYEHAPECEIWSFVTSHVVFLLLIHPNHKDDLERLSENVAVRWNSNFINAQKLKRANCILYNDTSVVKHLTALGAETV